MDEMFESSSSQGPNLGKRPASSSTALRKQCKKRASEEVEETHRIIHLTVTGQDKVINFKLKSTMKLQKILKSFCEKARVEYKTMKFLIDGSQFPPTATPDELHLSDGDEIQAMGWQSGGGGNAAGI